MSRATLRRRIERLEAASGGGEFTLAELVWWSYHSEERQPDNPDYVNANRRFMKSRLCRIMQQRHPIIAL